MSSAFPRGIILKNQFNEGEIINLKMEFCTYQGSHMECWHTSFLVVKATVVLVSLVSKLPRYPPLHGGCWLECHVFRMLFS